MHHPYQRMDDGEEEPTPRRKGLLPLLLLLSAAFAWIVHPEVRAATFGTLWWLFILAIGVPALAGVLVLVCTWVLTVIVRPNTLGPIDWYTAAWLQGLAAAVLALLASPLVNELAAAYSTSDLRVHIDIPALNLTLPTAAIDTGCIAANLSSADVLPTIGCLVRHVRLSSTEVQLRSSTVVIEYAWWFLGALLAVSSSAVFASHLLFSTVVLGFFFGSPALWRYTQVIPDDEALAALRDRVGAQCETQRDKYGFGMALRGAWAVENAELSARYEAMREEMAERGKASSVRRYFHGTRRDSASAITHDGFRLPGWHGMFGRGVYFADCPLKSLQYAGVGWGWKYMLVCDVEMGNTLVEQRARPELDPEAGVSITPSPGALSSLVAPFVERQPSFDSVSVPASSVGVRVPEYIIYKPAQAVPRCHAQPKSLLTESAPSSSLCLATPRSTGEDERAPSPPLSMRAIDCH